MLNATRNRTETTPVYSAHGMNLVLLFVDLFQLTVCSASVFAITPIKLIDFAVDRAPRRQCDANIFARIFRALARNEFIRGE